MMDINTAKRDISNDNLISYLITVKVKEWHIAYCGPWLHLWRRTLLNTLEHLYFTLKLEFIKDV